MAYLATETSSNSAHISSFHTILSPNPNYYVFSGPTSISEYTNCTSSYFPTLSNAIPSCSSSTHSNKKYCKSIYWT